MQRFDTIRRAAALVAIVPVLLACSTTQDLGRRADGATPDPTSPTGQPPGSVPSGEPLSARAACDRLLACASTQRPSQYGDFFPTFGTGGTCFATRDESECREACVAALGGLRDVQEGNVCNFCDPALNRGLCPAGSRLHGRDWSYGGLTCDPSTWTCEECVTDADCVVDSRPYCVSRLCVACRSDADCPAPVCANRRAFCGGRRGCEEGTAAGTTIARLTIEVEIPPSLQRAHLRADVATEPTSCGSYAGSRDYYLSGQPRVTLEAYSNVVGPEVRVRVWFDTMGDTAWTPGEPGAERVVTATGESELRVVFAAADF